jgi:bacteriocin-like protein
MKKKHQSSKEQPKTRAGRKPPQALTDEQLQQIVGGFAVLPDPTGPQWRNFPHNPDVLAHPTAVE